MTARPQPYPGPADDAAVVRAAPAKLNLTLAVRGLRSDGYHELHSVMVPLGLSDLLSVSASRSGADRLEVEGLDTGPPARNLVLAAFAEARRALADGPFRDAPTPALAARLTKRIPVAAGLGGGSSDAAAAIEAALAAWGLVPEPGHRGAEPASGRHSDDHAAALDAARRAAATATGSDVPFFLAGGPAAITGRGEHVDPLPSLTGDPPGVLLVCPAVPVPTPDVFGALHAPGGAPADPGATLRTSQHLAEEWRAGLDGQRLLARAGVLATANDLAAAAATIVPELRSLRRALTRRLGRPVGQSGSGPTLWVLYASKAEAGAAADDVRVALSDGSLTAPGDGSTVVVATTIQGRAGPIAAHDQGGAA